MYDPVWVFVALLLTSLVWTGLTETGRNFRVALVGFVGFAKKTLGHYAARGDESGVRQTLAEGADPNERDSLGRTPLHRATSPQVADLLVAAGADVSAQDREGTTPLYRAILAGRTECAIKLLALGADPNKGTPGIDPLTAALTGVKIDTGTNSPGKQVNIAEELLRRGADPLQAATYPETPLHVAAECGAPILTQMLLERGVDVNARDWQGHTPLFRAADKIAFASDPDAFFSVIEQIIGAGGVDADAQNLPERHEKVAQSFLLKKRANTLGVPQRLARLRAALSHCSPQPASKSAAQQGAAAAEPQRISIDT